MRALSISLIFFILGFPKSVTACEGDCIVGITNAFIGNYSDPINSVFRNTANQLANLVPPENRPADPMTFVEPILKAYQNTSYNTLETAIFPSYFHGKCQRFSKDGQDPPGCPNPDCPVVCGTPGSLVHFYSTLRYIVFNSTKHTLVSLSSPGSESYSQVNALVTGAQKRSLKRSVDDSAITTVSSGLAEDSVYNTSSRHGHSHPRRFYTSASRRFLTVASRSKDTSSVETILESIAPALEEACGSPATDGADSLSHCSWEAAMKSFILSFP